MKLKKGMYVKTTVLQFGYTPDNNTPIPIGTIGVVGAVKVPCVRKHDKCNFFNCVDFEMNGRKIRASYHSHELTTAEKRTVKSPDKFLADLGFVREVK